MRLFLALPLPPEVLRRLGEVAAGLRARSRELKVVQPESLHLTLVFLGERESREAEEVARLLEAPELAVPRIGAALGGYGQFPPHGSPRVLYTPLREGVGQVRELQAALSGVLRGGGIRLDEETRDFSPHITVARSREPRNAPEGLQELFEFEQRFTFDRLVLFQSLLRPQGAEHRPLKTVMFR